MLAVFRPAWRVPATVWMLAGFLAIPVFGTSPEDLRVEFDGGEVSAGFVLAGEGRAISLGLAGVGLRSARLPGTGEMAVDPVSRLIVFRGAKFGEGGLSLAREAPSAGRVSTRDGGQLTIEGRVKQVGDRYLPFTLLVLRHQGEPPMPGAPLTDGSGRVVAVAHQVVEEGRVYALPAEVVRRVVESLARDDRVERAWLGLTLDPRSNRPQVTRVVAGSPAARAGLRAGDMLRQVDSRIIRDYGDAVNAFFLLRPRREARIEVSRGSERLAVTLVPEAR